MALRGRQEIARLEKLLRNTYQRFDAIPQSETEARSDFTKYLCIITSGFMEQAVFELLMDFARKKNSKQELLRYIEQALNRFQNPSYEKLIALLASFSEAWKTSFEAAVTDEMAESINTVVSNRNRFAHGEQGGMTYRTLTPHFENIVKAVRELEGIVDP